MKGSAYRRGEGWEYRFDLGPDPLTQDDRVSGMTLIPFRSNAKADEEHGEDEKDDGPNGQDEVTARALNSQLKTIN